MKRVLWLSAISLILGGCGNLARIEPDPENRFYMPPVGTLIEVNHELTVPARWARVFLQRGETVPYGEVDRYHPSCDFELSTVDEKPQLIKPVSFTVIHVQPGTQEIVGYRPIQYASRSLMAYSGASSGGQYMIMHTVRMRLESEAQPGMYALTCRGALDDPPSALPVSIEEMRAALGDWASMVLPHER